jgi:hypothetical protein
MTGYSDDFEDENALWPVWRPLLGTFLAILLLGVLAIGGAQYLPATLAELAGYITGQVILVYAVLYFTALRRRDVMWKFGAFGLLLLFAALFNFAKVGREMERMRADMSGVRNSLSAALDGRQLTPGGAAPDSMSGITRDLVVKLQADQKALEAEAEAAGVNALLTPAALKLRPDVVKNCGAIDALAARVPAHMQRWRDRMADARHSIETMNAPDAMRSDVLRGFDESYKRDLPDLERRFELERLKLAELGGMCRVLARGHWQGTDHYMFTRDRDLADYQAIADRYNVYYTEQQGLANKGQSRARDSMDRLSRELK